MNKPLWAFAAIALLGTAGVAGAVAVASSGGEEEAVQQADSASPTETPTAAAHGTQTPSSTTSPSSLTPASPIVTPAPVPDGFMRYIHAPSNKAPAFSFAYPAGWFVTGGEPPEDAIGFGLTLTPWDPTTARQIGAIPSNSMKLDLHIISVGFEEGTCPAAGSEPATLGGQLGWKRTRATETDPNVTATAIAADYENYRYCIIGYFANPPDPSIFDRIVESFRFGE